MFLVPHKNQGIYKVFCPWQQKPRYLQCFWTAPSKNTSIYAVFIMLQEVTVTWKSQKPCELHWITLFWVCFWGARGAKGGVLKYRTTSWVVRQRGWPPFPLLRKVKLKVAQLELPFVIVHAAKISHDWEVLHWSESKVFPLVSESSSPMSSQVIKLAAMIHQIWCFWWPVNVSPVLELRSPSWFKSWKP